MRSAFFPRLVRRIRNRCRLGTPDCCTLPHPSLVASQADRPIIRVDLGSEDAMNPSRRSRNKVKGVSLGNQSTCVSLGDCSSSVAFSWSSHPLPDPPASLRTDADGVYRVGPTRVTLDTVVSAFQDGATAEEILLRYPALDLADIYVVLGYYLKNKPTVEAYLQSRGEAAEEMRREIEARRPSAGIRERLLERLSARVAEDS